MLIIGSLFDHLQILNLPDNLFTPDGMTYLEGSKSVSSLRELNIVGIKDELAIDAFKNLKVFECDNVAKPKSIHQLEVLKTGVYSKPNIENFPNLKYIRGVAGKTFCWDNLSHLECLSFKRHKQQLYIADYLDHLSIFKKLKELRICQTSLTIENIEIIAKNLNGIEYLKLKSVSSQGNEVISKLCDFKVIDRLNTLHLVNMKISDAGIENLISNSCLEKLTSLNLCFCDITEKGVISIAYCPKLSNLRHLSLQNTKAGLYLNHFVNGCLKKLNTFNIQSDCVNIQSLDEFLQSSFARKLTKCKTLYNEKTPWKHHNVELLKNRSNQDYKNLLQFMIKEPHTEKSFNIDETNTDIRDVNNNFRVQLKSIDNLLPSHLGFLPLGSIMLEFQAELCYGNKIIIEKCSQSFSCDYSKSIESNYWFNFTKRLEELPFECVVKIKIFVLKLSSMVKKQVISTVIPVFNRNRNHNHGTVQNILYSDFTPNGIKLLANFDKYHEFTKPFEGNLVELESENSSKALPNYFEDLMTKRLLTSEEKGSIWSFRSIIPNTYLGLRLLLESFPFMNYHALEYMRNYVKEVANSFSNLYQYLELLGEPFVDAEIRNLAHNAISQMTDEQLVNSLEIILELLAFEIYIDNPISLTLLSRSLNNLDIGRHLFWSIQGRLCNTIIREKLEWLITQYLQNLSNEIVMEFYNQCLYIYQLEEIHSDVETIAKDPSTCQKILAERVSSLELPVPFVLPYPPYKPVQRILAENTTLTDSRNRSLIINYESNGKTGKFIILNRDNKMDNYMTNILKILSDSWNEKYPNDQRNFVQYSIIPINRSLNICEVASSTLSEIHGKSYSAIYDPSSWIEFGNSQYPKFEKNFVGSYAFHAVFALVFKIGSLHNENVAINNEGFLSLYDKNSVIEDSRFGLKRSSTFFGSMSLSKILKTKVFKDLAVRNLNFSNQNSRLIYALLCELVQFGWNTRMTYGKIHEQLGEFLEPYDTIGKCEELVEKLINDGTTRLNLIHNLRHD